MKRILTLLFLAAPLALAACGPDCNAFCQRLRDCQLIANSADAQQNCEHSCGEVGGDCASTIACVNDTKTHSCDDLANGHCGVRGGNGGATCGRF